MEEKKPTVIQRYFEIVNSMGNVQRNATNPFARAKYASLSNIQTHLQPLLYEARLAVLFDFGTFVNNVYSVNMTVQDIDNPSDTLVFPFAVPIDSTQKNAVQAFGSTTTYAQRYILCVAFQIALDDTDPDVQAPQAPTPTKQSTPAPVKAPAKIMLKSDSPEYQSAVAYLATGGGTIEKIETKYTLTPSIRAKLQSDALELITPKTT
jgi:hypothetical protein